MTPTRHTADAIRRASRLSVPWEHNSIQRILPVGMYDEILQMLPGDSKTVPLLGYGELFRYIELRHDTLKEEHRMHQHSYRFWRAVGRFLRAHDVVRALCESLGISGDGLYPDVYLTLALPGFEAPPQYDLPGMAAMLQIYLAPHPFGPVNVPPAACILHGEDELKVPYAANTALAYLRGNRRSIPRIADRQYWLSLVLFDKPHWRDLFSGRAHVHDPGPRDPRAKPRWR